ncbi:MAG: hypothetical protein E4G91_11215, partial [Candidatus Zixiibacteriota bacterium]
MRFIQQTLSIPNGAVKWTTDGIGIQAAQSMHMQFDTLEPSDTTFSFIAGYAPIGSTTPEEYVSFTLYRNECGRYGYSPADINQDCYVNLLDLADLA